MRRADFFCAPLAALFALAALVAPAARADSARGLAPREWAFDVFLEDKRIGQQTFREVDQDGKRRVSIRADLDVEFFFINVYSYRHTNEEIWRDGCLERIEASTDDNGAPFRVRGARRERDFVVETQTSTVTLDDCVWTFAYWNEGVLTRRKLLNSQTGDYEDVTATLIGDETIEFRGRRTPARRWALESPKFRIDLWYSPEREWLALESQSKGGRRLRYVRE